MCQAINLRVADTREKSPSTNHRRLPIDIHHLDTDPLCSTWKKLKLTLKFSEPNATE